MLVNDGIFKEINTLIKRKYIRKLRWEGAVEKSYMRKGFPIYEEMPQIFNHED
jgi:hypothetical protein